MARGSAGPRVSTMTRAPTHPCIVCGEPKPVAQFRMRRLRSVSVYHDVCKACEHPESAQEVELDAPDDFAPETLGQRFWRVYERRSRGSGPAWGQYRGTNTVGANRERARVDADGMRFANEVVCELRAGVSLRDALDLVLARDPVEGLEDAPVSIHTSEGSAMPATRQPPDALAHSFPAEAQRSRELHTVAAPSAVGAHRKVASRKEPDMMRRTSPVLFGKAVAAKFR